MSGHSPEMSVNNVPHLCSLFQGHADRAAGRRRIPHHHARTMPHRCTSTSWKRHSAAMKLTITKEQIDDICRKSKEVWEKQAAARMKNDKSEGPEKPLKRPLNQPILVSRATDSGRRDERRRSDDRSRSGGSARRSEDERWRDDRRR